MRPAITNVHTAATRHWAGGFDLNFVRTTKNFSTLAEREKLQARNIQATRRETNKRQQGKIVCRSTFRLWVEIEALFYH